MSIEQIVAHYVRNNMEYERALKYLVLIGLSEGQARRIIAQSEEQKGV